MKKTDARERRRLNRWQSTYFFRGNRKFEKPYFDVIDQRTEKSIGHLVDLTLEGFKIICREAIPRNEVFELRIELPKEVEGVRQIDTRAQCVWCERDINPEFFNAGFRIISISPPFTEIVETLITG